MTARATAALLTREPPAARELAVALLLLAAAGVAAYGSHVIGGSFYSDDWPNAADYGFRAEPGLTGALAHALDLRFFDYRPLSALAIAASHGLLGVRPELHLAAALAIGVLASASFYWLLRALGLARIHALAIAVLVLLFPWSDATRLWPTASINGLAVCLWALGVVVALRGLRESGRRAVAIHAAALCLYALSILTYELAAGPVLVAGVLYAVRSPWWTALRRFAADALTVALTVGNMALNTPRTPRPFGDQLGHAGRIAREAWSLLVDAAVPLWSVPGAILGAMVLALLAGAIVLARRSSPEAERELRRWLTTFAVAAAALPASYLLVVPADPFFSPLTPGIANRVNLFATLAVVTLVYALAMLLHAVLSSTLPRDWRTGATGVSAAAILLVGVGYVARLEEDKSDWRRSTLIQERVRAALDRMDPPPGSTVYAFGSPIYAAPGVPVFRHLELTAAVALDRGDSSVDAYPMYTGSSFECGSRGLYPASDGYGNRTRTTPPNEFLVEAGESYGSAFFLDTRSGRVERIEDEGACRTAQSRFEPGPSLAGGYAAPP